MSLDYILREMETKERGFAAHYLFLYSAVRGLSAQRVLEFGAGMSTRVILDALAHTGGLLVSLSTDSREEVARRAGFVDPGLSRWEHLRGVSTPETSIAEGQSGPFDLVLHDGAHDFATVRADLAAVVPRVKYGGLVLVHDTAHSHCGAAMRAALDQMSLRDADSVVLPYGYGLTIIGAGRWSTGTAAVRVDAFDKPSSPHRTVLR